MKTRSDSELSKKKWRNNSSDGDFFSKHFGLIHLAGLRVLKHFLEKKITFSFHFLCHLSLLLHPVSSFLFHLLSSFSSCLFSSLALLSSCLLSSLLSLLFSCLESSLVFLSPSSLSCLVLSCTVFSCLVLSLFLCLCLSLVSVSVLSLSLSLSLCLRVMLCVVLCGVCRCGRGVVWWSWCVWCVCSCVCVCVCCGTLKKTWKNPCVGSRTSRVYIQNVPVYAGTTRTCVSTCARGAGTHGDVLNATHGGVLNVHTGTQGIECCLPKFAHVWSSRASEIHHKKPMDLTHFSLRIGREQHVADSSNHSLCLMKLFSFSNPGGHCGG